MHLRAQHEPGQSYPHYGLRSAAVGHRHYLLHLSCKYRKDVVLFIWSTCLFVRSSPKAKLSFLFPDLDIPHQQGAMCLCLTWGRAFPHHNWEKGEPSQLSKSFSRT